MSTATSFDFKEWPGRVAGMAGGLVCLTGIVVLLGWAFDLAVVKSVRPEWPKMAASTSLVFVLAGAALMLAILEPAKLPLSIMGDGARDRRALVRRLTVQGCGGLAALMGLLKLSEYSMGWPLGFDPLIFTESPDGFSPGRMAPATAFNFFLLGCALMLACSARLIRVFQILTLLGGVVGWVGFSHYLYGGEALLPFAQMAVHTAAAFVILSAGLHCARTDGGLTALLISNSAGGMIARRLLPPALLFPIVLSLLRLQGQRAGWYGTEAGLALFALSNVLVFGALIWAVGAQLHHTDTGRRQAEQSLRDSQHLLQSIIDNSPAVIYVKDLEGHYLLVNRRFSDLFHISQRAIAGKTDYDLFPKEAADAFRAMDRRVAAAAVALTEEEAAPHDDGPHTYVSVKCPLWDDTGKPYAVFGISTDITERKRNEEALSASEERTRSIIDTALDAVITIDSTGVITGWSLQAETTFGWTRQEAIGRSLAETIIPEPFRGAHRRGLHHYLATGQTVVLNTRIELTALHRDGHEFPIELAITTIRIGGAIAFSAFVRDITERKQTEAALRASEERFRTMADSAPVMIWVSGADKLCTWFNRQWLEFVGRTMSEELGNGWAENVHPDDFDRCLQTYTTAFDAREPFSMEYRLRRRDGAWRWVLDKGVPNEGAGRGFAGYLGSCIDITERKQAAEALRESQKRYQTLAESLPHLVWTCNPDGWCDYLSRQWVQYTGRPAEEQHGSGWAEQLHPEDRERVQAAWAQATARGDQFDIEFRIRRADGVYRWFKTRAVPLRDDEGSIVKWFGSNTDFEDYKQAEQRLRTHLERLNLLHQITRAIGERQDLKSIFQVVIRSLEDHLPLDFGCLCLYEPAEAAIEITSLGRRSEALATKLDLQERSRIPVDGKCLARSLNGQLVYEPEIAGLPYLLPQRLAQGGMRSLVSVPLMVGSEVFGLLIAVRRQPNSFSSSECEFLQQLTEHVALAAHQAQLHGLLQQAYDDLRQTQQAVMQEDRLRALGQMASGIAHDINNAISPVALYTESLLEQEPGLSPRARDYLETIQHAIEDVAQTVARMREFYRQREPQLTLTPVHLNHLVQQVVDLTRARWSDMPQQRGIVIELSTELQPGLPVVMGVESEIREAFINLIFNAVDAMPDGGELRVRTTVADDKPDSAETMAARRVYVEVNDTGAGMNEDTRRRCLEPFFSTKGERGTGLGLAMVYGMVKRHSAEIEIGSAVGKGTTVRLSFAVPVVAVAGSAQSEPEYAAPSPLHILIVDDDPLLLKSLHDALTADGHSVSTVSDGQGGIDAFREARGRSAAFDVVITDLGMPYVDGRKVAGAVKDASPLTPVILLTGWGQRLISEDDLPAHVDRILNKPPKLRELREALAHCCQPVDS